MHDIFYSPYIVPLGGMLVGLTWVGFSFWNKVKERELNHERDLRQKEMEHQLKLKELDLELARLQEGKPGPS